jgi:glutamyl-tRNA reductase
MHLFVIGLNHKTAPVEIREQISFSGEKLKNGLIEAKKQFPDNETVILSTCNRVEVYVLSKDQNTGENIKKFLSDFHGCDKSDLPKYLYVYQGKEAVEHIIKVAASLDSMVLGETQIFGQVKEAFKAAKENDASKKGFEHLSQKIYSIVKNVRTKTDIGRLSVSVSSIAVETAAKLLGTLKGKTVMAAGAGKMGEMTAKCFVSKGVSSVYVLNRTYERAVEFAKSFGGCPAAFEDLHKYMAESDVIIVSTGAPHYIIKEADAKEVMHIRKTKPLFIIDISVPRNVDPSVKTVKHVHLKDIDDLNAASCSNMNLRIKSVKEAEKIIKDGIENLDKHSSYCL